MFFNLYKIKSPLNARLLIKYERDASYDVEKGKNIPLQTTKDLIIIIGARDSE